MNLTESDFIDFVKAKGASKTNHFSTVDANIVEMECGGYRVSVNDNELEVTLASSRKSIRRFASIDSAASFLRKIGFKAFACLKR